MHILWLIPLILVLVYIGIYHPGNTWRCPNCKAKITKIMLVCPNCKKRLYKD